MIQTISSQVEYLDMITTEEEDDVKKDDGVAASGEQG